MRGDEGPRAGRTVELPDGRRLGYAEHGDPSGLPLLFFPGFGDSRLTRHPDAAIAERRGVRVIVLERPGYGLSTRRPGRDLLAWASDVAAAADGLGLGEVAVAGWSLGAPHALACAAALGRRVRSVVLFSPVGPLDHTQVRADLDRDFRNIHRFRNAGPLLHAALARTAGRARRRPGAFVESEYGGRRAGWADRAVLRMPGVREMLEAEVAEASRQGSAGYVDDVVPFTSPWPFRPEEIRQPVLLLQGTEDGFVGSAGARLLEARLRRCRARLLPGEGHLLWITRWRESLEAVAGVAGG